MLDMETLLLAFIIHGDPFVFTAEISAAASFSKVRVRKLHVVECQEFVRQEWNY